MQGGFIFLKKDECEQSNDCFVNRLNEMKSWESSFNFQQYYQLVYFQNPLISDFLSNLISFDTPWHFPRETTHIFDE